MMLRLIPRFLRSVSVLRTDKISVSTNSFASQLQRIHEKADTIKRLEPTERFHKAMQLSFDQYVTESLLMENIDSQDQRAREGIKNATIAASQIQVGQVKIEDIQEIHRLLMKDTNPRIAGRIRTEEVVVLHPPKPGEPQFISDTPHPETLRSLMKNYTDFLNQPTEGESIFITAAKAKLFAVYIHPFEDGNGRLSRAILNGFVQKERHPFIVIPAAEIEEYFNCIATYRPDGNAMPFVNYSLRCIERSFEIFLSNLEQR